MLLIYESKNKMENKNFHILSQEIIKTKAHCDNYLALNEMIVLSSTTLLANITKQKNSKKNQRNTDVIEPVVDHLY